MCSRSPVYSSGERTSTSGLPRCASTSSRKARIGASTRCTTGYSDALPDDGVGRHGPPFGDPLGPAAVQQPDVVVAEQAEHPQGVGRPPVALVAVDDHRGFPADPLAGHQVGERGAVDVVTADRVVEVEVPVHLDRAGDVAGVVEQHVLVGLHDHEPGVAEVRGQPVGGDQPLRVRVLGDLGVVVERDRRGGHGGLVSQWRWARVRTRRRGAGRRAARAGPSRRRSAAGRARRRRRSGGAAGWRR